MHYRQNRTISQCIHLSLIISLGLFLNGCNVSKPAPKTRIAEPPLVPAPIIAPQKKENTDTKEPLLGAYPDLMAQDDETPLHPSRLREAITRALKMGVLNPINLQEEFSPKKPIYYGTFREWVIAYQQASSGSSGIIGTMNLPGNKTLPSSLSWGGHTVTASQILTRQDLCVMYVFLTNQVETAQALTPTQIESASPSHDNMSMDETLSQFKDYATISSWAKRYVAVTYQDNLLQKIFNLTPNQLTLEQGFAPKQEATREEAILLLDSLYADTIANNGQKTKLLPIRQALQNPDSAHSGQSPYPSQPSLPVTPIQPERPRPLTNLKTLHETGLHGTRNATQMNRP
jgi:hypothetical protein